MAKSVSHTCMWVDWLHLIWIVKGVNRNIRDCMFYMLIVQVFVSYRTKIIFYVASSHKSTHNFMSGRNCHRKFDYLMLDHSTSCPDAKLCCHWFRILVLHYRHSLTHTKKDAWQFKQRVKFVGYDCFLYVLCSRYSPRFLECTCWFMKIVTGTKTHWYTHHFSFVVWREVATDGILLVDKSSWKLIQ